MPAIDTAVTVASISAAIPNLPWHAKFRSTPNVGWGDGLFPFVLIGVPVIAFLVWFEIARRRRKR